MSWLHLRHTGLEWIASQISKKRFFKKVKKVCNFNRICNDDLFKLLKSSSKIRKNRKDLCKEALMLFLIKYNEQTLQIPEVFYYPAIFCPTVLLKELHTLSLKQDILKNTRKARESLIPSFWSFCTFLSKLYGNLQWKKCFYLQRRAGRRKEVLVKETVNSLFPHRDPFNIVAVKCIASGM